MFRANYPGISPGAVQERYLKSRDVRLRDLLLVIFHRRKGMSPQAIAEIILRIAPTVREWIRNFNTKGFEGLHRLPIPDRPFGLSPKQQ